MKNETIEFIVDFLKTIMPVLLVVLGSSLSSINNYFSSKRELKKAIASTLSDLLEIRARISAVHTLISELKKHVEVTFNDNQNLRKQFEQSIPLDNELHKRYSSSVTKIAEIDPILGFRLRSQNNIGSFFQTISEISNENISSEELEKFEYFLMQKIIPIIDESLKNLAQLHSRSTLKKLNSKLLSFDSPNEELENYFEELKILNTQKQ